VKTVYHGEGSLKNWEIELSTDYNGTEVVFVSNLIDEGNKVTVNAETGRFLGPLKGRTALTSGAIYFVRVRQQSIHGQWSAWSRWHQGFRVE